MSIKTLLEDEIKEEIKELSKTDTGSKEYEIASNGLSKLIDKKLEMEKLDLDVEYKRAALESEERMKIRQMEMEKTDQKVKNVLTGVSIGGGFALTIWGALKSWEFEKEGTVSSFFGRLFMNRFTKK